MRYEVNSLNFSQSYPDYDTARQLELESYGYRFLRINRFNLRPQSQAYPVKYFRKLGLEELQTGSF